MIEKNSKIFLAGHKGHVGSAILKKLKIKGFKKIITADNFTACCKKFTKEFKPAISEIKAVFVSKS